MGKTTEISWTDHTFNPWWGCQRVSPGCENCYAETFAKRLGLNVWGPRSDHRFFGDKHWAEPLKWNADAAVTGVRRRVFCASMADVFEDRPDLVRPRDRLLSLIEQTPCLDWQLLTKRPENMVRLASPKWGDKWPANVWAGTTAEDQTRLELRAEWLLEVPAAVRFLSCEPLLGPLDLENVEPYYLKRDKRPHDPIVRLDCLRGHMKGPDEMLDAQIDWVIVGGESGGGSRPFSLEWAKSIVDQCRGANVPVFVKQLGAKPYEEADGEGGIGDLIKLRNKKGGDMEEWPWRTLKVREFPEVSP